MENHTPLSSKSPSEILRHEIRNKLNTMAVAADLLIRTHADDSDTVEVARTILECAKDSANLINQLNQD